jgi:hypothetical protein
MSDLWTDVLESEYEHAVEGGTVWVQASMPAKTSSGRIWARGVVKSFKKSGSVGLAGTLGKPVAAPWDYAGWDYGPIQVTIAHGGSKVTTTLKDIKSGKTISFGGADFYDPPPPLGSYHGANVDAVVRIWNWHDQTWLMELLNSKIESFLELRHVARVQR